MLELRAPNPVDIESRTLCLFYPQDCFKAMFWDIMMAICLLLTCILVPFNMAFNEELELHLWFTVFMLSVDAFFAIDIFVNFNSAISLDDVELIDNRK